MSDDFQTVSAKRGEALRAHYRRHREALMNLVSDAPTELIAAHYRRVIADIDVSLAKLDQTDSPLPPPPIRRSEPRSEEHTSELQSLAYLVCRLLLEKKKKKK